MDSSGLTALGDLHFQNLNLTNLANLQLNLSSSTDYDPPDSKLFEPPVTTEGDLTFQTTCPYADTATLTLNYEDPETTETIRVPGTNANQ